jgi:hypothetical protein
MIRKITALAGAAVAATALSIGGMAVANAATVPLINVTVGSSNGGVAGYYGADDGHSHFRYTQVLVTATPTLENLNGVSSSTLGAVGTELCDENADGGSGYAAQIGLYDNGGKYGVAYDWGDFASNTFDDACIDAGLLNPDIVSAYQLLGNITIHAGDKILVSVYYNPSGRGHHELQFAATDETQTNEHRSATESIPTQSFTEFGDGVVSDASTVTAALNNNLETFGDAVFTCYSCAKALPIAQDDKYYSMGDGGLSQVQYVNTSDQPEISPNSSLTSNAFTVFEGSTTP